MERAAAAGDGVYGGIVLNSPVGGANPDAVEVAARLGGRVVWMPTVSVAHPQARRILARAVGAPAASSCAPVDVIDDSGRLLPQWHEVLDVIADHDLLLASGHLSADETVVLFARPAAAACSA